MALTSTEYDFELDAQRGTRADAQTVLPKLISRLGLVTSDYPMLNLPLPRRDLENLIIHCHLNIRYYQKRLKEENTWRWGYVGATVAIVLTVPFLMKYLSEKSANVVMATTFLSAIYGAHRVATGWFEKRRVSSHFAKASAELKNVLYSFEQHWDEVRLLTFARAREFERELRAVVGRCKAIVDQERIDYYRIVENVPKYEVDTILGTARSAALNYAKTFSQAVVPASADTKQAAAVFTAEIATLKASLADQESCLNQLTANTPEYRTAEEGIREDYALLHDLELRLSSVQART